MKNILFLIILFPINVFSQTDSIDCHKFYKEHESSSLESPVIDQLPEPIGGMDSLYKKLIYPIEALKGDVQGKVYIKVIIDTLGNPHCPFISKGLGYGCDKEAIRIIMSTHFIPAVFHKKKIVMEIMIPIKFILY